MNRISKLLLISEFMNKHRCHTCLKSTFDMDKIIQQTQNYNEFETKKYLQFLKENKYSINPYYQANQLLQRFYDYPKSMSE